jgi:putative SOS response-associated peptidase YedK
MCGRYTLSQGEKIVEAIPNITIREDLRRLLDGGRFNIAPTQDVLVAVQAAAGPELQVMQWGLVPAWAKDAESPLINARAETLAEKPTFRGALRARRCVVPADGFYEWRTNGDGSKTPLYIRLKSRRGFAFAGLWETWKDPTGETLRTCTIITTPANALVATIHNRMPAILTAEEVRQWLAGDTGAESPEGLLALLGPFPAGEMEMHAVSRAVNFAGREGRELIEPVEDVPGEGGKAGKKSRVRREKSDQRGQGELF